ncbi:hypothetical protein [Desulfosarcina cetonica]|uniref:hypothetical protein n=1 Tax=Desulfosarcina cetonica TaxID=90730 RepID=UPI0006CFDC01|nr:hypothetical protein [Desulfosarcina cetonica]
MSIARYGEGFNINPTITIAKDGERWGAGIGIGYLWRGEYDFSDTTPDFDPGDIYNVTAEILYAFSESWQGRVLGEMAWYGIDSVEGRDYYQEGDFFLAGIGLNYVQDRWDAAFTLKGIYRGKCDFQEGNQRLATEERSGFGDEYLADLVVRVQLNPETKLSSRLYYLAVLENDYPGDDPLFIDGKQKVSLRFSLERQLADDFSGRIGLEGYRMDEGRNWYHDDDREYRGMVVDCSLTKTF